MLPNNLPELLLDRGVTVREVSGWQTRGKSLAVHGIVFHHTAAGQSPTRDASSLNIIVNGHTGLPGPIANFHITSSGVISLVAAGRANHAGVGSGVVVSEMLAGVAPTGDARDRALQDTSSAMNGLSIGVEVDNDGTGEPWSDHLLQTCFRLFAALCDIFHLSPNSVVGHREYTARKIDPSWRGDWRVEIEKLMHPIDTPTPPTETDDMTVKIVYPVGPDGTAYYARFIGQFDSRGLCSTMWWADSERYNAYKGAGAPEVPLSVAQIRNVALIGDVPTGDLRNWVPEDFAA